MFFRYLSGDTNAFEDLVSLHEETLFNFINSIVNDYHESKHLTIESFARLALNGGKYAGKSSIKTYLFAIGKNLALRYVKERKRIQHIPFEEVVDMVVDGGETPQAYVEREESKNQLHAVMKGLKDEHRAVLMLLYFDDMSYLQAGRAMNKTEKQIKHLAYRAKQALKKKLETSGYAN